MSTGNHAPAAPRKAERGMRRPAGWVAPGPKPRGAAGEADLLASAHEDLAFLTGDFRIFQLKRGHRWSVDDFLTAYLAGKYGPSRVNCALDLGCGIGSVLQMVAWLHPAARLHGIEAQALSVALAARSVRYNGLSERVQLLHGDLRECAANLDAHAYDLITGTPPYFPEGNGTVSAKPQKAPCLFETRGGIEDYALAAAPRLHENGAFWVCAGPYPESRGPSAAAAANLHISRWFDVEPRRGKPILFRVFEMRRQPCALQRSTFMVREADGTLTEMMHEARAFMGLPPSQEVRAYADGIVPSYSAQDRQ